MDFLDVYYGRCEWVDYVLQKLPPTFVESGLHRNSCEGGDQASAGEAGLLTLSLSADDYAVARHSGLGALGQRIGSSQALSGHRIQISLAKLAAGLDCLNADFNLLLGDLVWSLEMQDETLKTVLQEIRLAEFEREARAYRYRAERAYLNGWYEEALSDCLEAEKRNYPDFAVLRLIANIYLYHLIDLQSALQYFRKAAKYSRPSDSRQSAEAHYYAGIVCTVQRKLDEAVVHLREAVALNHQFYEAHYQHARLSALQNDNGSVLTSLRSAAGGDPRYHERAKTDAAFDMMRREIEALLGQMMTPVQERLTQLERNITIPAGCVVAKPEEQKVYVLLQEVRHRVSHSMTYKEGLEFLDALSGFEHQLRDISHLFYKQYDIGLQDYVRCQAFSRDGQWLATGLLSGEIKLWEVFSGINVGCLTGHVASVNSVAFSPNNLWLASGSRDKLIKIWDAETGGQLRTLAGHDGEVRAVAFSPTGEFLVSGSHDCTVRIWRAITGQQAQILGRHQQAVTSAAFSPDGRLVASGSQDTTVRLWDVATGMTEAILKGHTRGVESLAFSPDGRLLASGGEDRQIKVWDVRTRAEINTLGGLRSGVSSLAFSPDGNLLAAGCLGTTVQVWRLDAGRILTTLKLPEISYNAVAFSPHGQWLALGTHELQLWLKIILSQDEYSAVRAGEARARLEQADRGGEGLFRPRVPVPYFSTPKFEEDR